MSYKSCLLWPC